ncbi:DUF6538 domain-containing protein [Crenobacter intestini]|uniref:DUF6538 domain-containing protein n=1 Tax=Crenobacter intestini TaxID=2563443 RepID=A0A4T0V128_9NEIS|nr:DUF6538 domain-containing protein [Crenobacter intestini]TIC85214.1 hypothetical protein E5K04_04235 [Crenobacter intestini]
MASYLRLRGSTYHFRLVLPEHLRSLFNRREVACSLGTGNRAAAKAMALELAGRIFNLTNHIKHMSEHEKQLEIDRLKKELENFQARQNFREMMIRASNRAKQIELEESEYDKRIELIHQKMKVECELRLANEKSTENLIRLAVAEAKIGEVALPYLRMSGKGGSCGITLGRAVG